MSTGVTRAIPQQPSPLRGQDRNSRACLTLRLGVWQASYVPSITAFRQHGPTLQAHSPSLMTLVLAGHLRVADPAHTGRVYPKRSINGEVCMIRFTRHARNRMRLWRLTEAVVTEALRQPDQVTPSSQGQRHAWKQHAAGWLRVTYSQEDQTLMVITVTVRRRGPGEV
jgi:hypothetical protein